MATDKTDFEIYLKSRWDGDAMKAAEADFKKTQKAVKDTDTSMRDMGYSADALKTQLMSLVAFAEVVAQFREGFEQVAALEQAMNQLERATKRNGDNFEDVKGKIVGMANALKKAAGVDDDAAIKKMSELYNATGDVANAMNLVALATDVAIGAGLDFERANDLVTKAAMGQTRGLKELNISIEETGDKSGNANVALAAITKNFGGAAENAKGLKVELNRLSEAYEDFRNNAVESTTPILTAWLKFAKTWVAVIGGAADMIGEIVHGVFLVFMKAGDALGMLLKGNVAGAKLAMREAGKDTDDMFDAIVQTAHAKADEVAAIWAGQGGVGIGAGKAKSIVAGGGDKGKKDGESRDESKWVLIDGVLYSRADLLAATESLYKKSKAIADREEKFADAQRKRERADAKQTATEIEKDRDAGFRRMTKQIADEVKLKKAAAEAEKEMAFEVANASLALAGQLFGDSKELAIASAIINTYEGATKALGQGGIYGPVLAAIVIASGLAQVAKIVSTKPATEGAGFDDPGNDAAARIGGRRWAADMIGEFTGGVSEGWAQGMRGGGGNSTTTNDNRRTFNVHMHGAGFIDPNNIQMMKQFKRTLDVIETTVEGQRHIARTAR
jgi:hypothetical protein